MKERMAGSSIHPLQSYLTRDFLLSLMNANPLEDRPTIPELRQRYVIETFYEVGREFQVAKALNMDYRSMRAILRKRNCCRRNRATALTHHCFPITVVIC
jgi:hypothetical protein